MKYRIISPRVGTPGELWEPPVQINVGILLANGFIEAIDDNKPTDETPDAPKPKKAKVATSEKE